MGDSAERVQVNTCGGALEIQASSSASPGYPCDTRYGMRDGGIMTVNVSGLCRCMIVEQICLANPLLRSILRHIGVCTINCTTRLRK
jgi:hypothetical protein